MDVEVQIWHRSYGWEVGVKANGGYTVIAYNEFGTEVVRDTFEDEFLTLKLRIDEWPPTEEAAMRDIKEIM